jgi:predicted Zn finger-like uncharacterized protein
MIIVCQNCSARIQIDDAKVPSSSFSVRCPKCAVTINSVSASPASQKSALSVGGSPSTDHPRFERPKPAPAFEPPDETLPGEPSDLPLADVARALTELLARNPQATESGRTERPKWNRRQVLVCAAEARRETIARMLADSGYQVFVAEDTRQAVERMRENRLEVVLLDPEFDPAEQGAAFVTREVNILRPAQRRRLFFGLISPSFRTLDAHAAFLNNANITVNLNDLAELPAMLDRTIREYNELYFDFYRALNVPAL